MTNERTYVERFDSGLDSRPLLELADAEIEELKHDNERLMKSLNAEVNAHEPSPEPTPNGRCKCIFCGAGFVMWGDTSVHERSCSKNPVNAVSRSGSNE